MDEKPYQCALLGLTATDVTVLKSLVPSTVRSCFDERFTFRQQTSLVKARDTLYLERAVPALAEAEDHWAALCLLAKSNHNIQANNRRRERRRELSKLAEMQRRAKRRMAMDLNPDGDETEDLSFYLRHGFNQNNGAGAEEEERGNEEGASKYPVATLTIQKRRTQRVDLPRGPRRRKGAQGLGLERDANI